MRRIPAIASPLRRSQVAHAKRLMQKVLTLSERSPEHIVVLEKLVDFVQAGLDAKSHRRRAS